MWLRIPSGEERLECWLLVFHKIRILAQYLIYDPVVVNVTLLVDSALQFPALLVELFET